MMALTEETYRTLEAERHYMSVSQLSGWLECEAKQAAVLKGDWMDEPSREMLVGSFIHAWVAGTLDAFKAANPEIFTKKGELRSEFQQAADMIATLRNDPFTMHVLAGEKEVAMTAELFGVPWKARFDVYVPGKRIVDLKTTRSIRDLQWSQALGGRVFFFEQYNYFRQAAIYQEIERINTVRPEGSWLDYYIVAVSKEAMPDKEVISLVDPERTALELDEVRRALPTIMAVKSGDVEPERCERCDYCRFTKRLSRAVHYTELGGL